MASRESQGLQIALILFVMVTVVLAVTTYFFFRKAEEKIKQAADDRDKASKSANAAKLLDYENQVLKHVIGLNAVDTKTPSQLETIKQNLGANEYVEKLLVEFDQDMATYGAGFDPDETLNYRALPGHLMDQVNRRNTQLADQDATITDLQDDVVEAARKEKLRADAAEAGLNKAQADYATRMQEWTVNVQDIANAKDALAAKLPLKDERFAKLQAEMATRIGERDAELRNRQDALDMATVRLAKALKPEEFERPDGKIVYVNQRADVVWIDLGSDDGIQRQMTFSVYDQDQVGATNAEIKAKIQITAVNKPHSSEARILEHDLGNPIMTEDKIYSPTFRKGQKTRFALAGFFDIDGDGKSDQKKVKSIITINGGVVDAELLEDGSIAGKITLDTRYLVRGEAPTDKTDEQRITGWNKMQEDAVDLGLETMPLDELLARMGYQDDSRVIDLQRGGPGGSGASESFRKRRPSAYP